MSLELTKPSSAALQTALRAFLEKERPPPLVPHPPKKNTTWRTRRIVAELNALKSVGALTNFETELRGVLLSQETRCRTKLMAATFGAEGALRERELIEGEETTQRSKIAETYWAETGKQFDLLHTNLQEEWTRRALRRSERSERRALARSIRTTQLFLRETNDRVALCAQEECCREEIRYRRVIEIGNDLQREIVTECRLSGHLRSVAYSRTVQETRRQIELQEDRDRSAVERLYHLHTIALFECAKEDFSAAIRKDVVLLSDTNRDTAQQAAVTVCASNLLRCVEQETQLRLLVEEQETALFKTLSQNFLLGWRVVYKAITKDPDVRSVFSKVELLVRHQLAGQERTAFDALRLAAECRMSACKRHRGERRALCQDYVTGARALWEEENRAANVIFRQLHLWQKEAGALQAVTVLGIAETAARRGVCSAEAQVRLRLKIKYAAVSVLLSCAAVTQRILADEAHDFNLLRRRYIGHFHTRQKELLTLGESAARAVIDHCECTAAADLFLSLRQSLARFRASDVSRPLLLVEEHFRSQTEKEELEERHALALLYCCLQERSSRLQVEADERSSHWHRCVAQLCDSEQNSRRALCTAATEQLSSLHTSARSTLEEIEVSNAASKRGVAADQHDADEDAFLLLNLDGDLPECVEQAWQEVYADWELTENASSLDSYESQKVSGPPLLNSYAAQCEEMLTDAYLQRDLIHFAEHAEWRRLLRRTQKSYTDKASPVWTLHSISLKQEPNQRAASVNMWDSSQLFDVSFYLAQQQEEGIVGERTIAFYVPYAPSAAAVMPRCANPGMAFFLILDEEGTVLSSANLVMEACSEDVGYLCVPLDNSAGYLRFE
ncbi:hypothetical protein ABB37_04914 [Leptomonas pyrrhocoris]|uniref:Uncharacterized protein n=1 Tax=Leptomonas pyrrhocoris TaxID=157538 RepID=A0A0M9G0D1_LEPPY|nr:hypothetical protein ABB37_04914 [Leptomonas pyrrhocoris]XP_015658260.1 hypothetical protein ABB37_04914 [Leptomonas pyrrhocoris]KPA79820.1 hypothetical protein ABB37_04914 [Leptomonas pyrrhocoris]KPA79821.1 hypothetical protein ABB37_04914 [Leptomonas pyrrhocoris]|eukprot:XP_015658259.1 hypothetical protein ABB37_04914 [Leptomonas pyrrhocoris]